jgi:hypothetical protein
MPVRSTVNVRMGRLCAASSGRAFEHARGENAGCASYSLFALGLTLPPLVTILLAVLFDWERKAGGEGSRASDHLVPRVP